jgi:hypothetical protein
MLGTDAPPDFVGAVAAFELLVLLQPASTRIEAAAMLIVLRVRNLFLERNFIIPSWKQPLAPLPGARITRLGTP